MIKKLFFCTFLVCSCFAKEQEISLFVDENSNKYIKTIKEEATSLFSSSYKLKFKVEVCKNSCLEKVKTVKAIVLLNSAKKLKNTQDNYIITYNHIGSIYDENRVIRRTALAIYDFIMEKKRDSFYLKNKVIKKAKSKSNYELLELKDIFVLAKKNNLDLKLNKNSTKLKYLDIQSSQDEYRPKVDIYSNYMQVDQDRAKYSNGQLTQKSLEAGLKIKQLIYSNAALQNIKINKLLYKSSKKQTKALDDEIMYRATLIYLNIIKAQKSFEIIKIKHGFIAQNLTFAKQRVEVGAQDRSDIFRWQSELSNANIELANSRKQLNSLKIELKNLLQIEQEYEFKEYGMNSKLFKLLNKDAIKYLEDKRVQEAFTKELVYLHARLEQLKELEKAKYEELSMNKKSRYLPTLAFEGSAKRNLDRSGAGEDINRPWDDEEYQAVLNLNLPLYEGGAKSTRIQKNEIELINLKLNYKNMRNLILENVRKNYESLSRSYEKIDFSKQAEHSSRKNFELIQDKYKNGEENIISLLDAQNAYIVSKLNLNISITDYLSDLSAIYFFTGKMDILVDDEIKQRVEEKIISIVEGEK